MAEVNHLRESIISQSPWADELFGSISRKIGKGGIWNEPAIRFYMPKLAKLKKDPSNWRFLLTEDNKISNSNTLVVNKKGKI